MGRRRVLTLGGRRTDDSDKLKRFDEYAISLGDEMRGRRATLGKNLLDAGRDLNIRANLINAIESADLASFKDTWIIPGYVRCYAKYLGMDPEDCYQRFCAESGFVANSAPVANGNRTNPLSLKHESNVRQNRFGLKKKKKSKRRNRAFRAPIFDKSTFQAVLSALMVGGLICGIFFFGWTVYGEINSVRQASLEIQAPQNTEFSYSVSIEDNDSANLEFDSVLFDSETPARVIMGEIRPGEYGIYAESDESVEFEIEDAFLVAESNTIADDLSPIEPLVDLAAEVADETEQLVDLDQVVLAPVRATWVRVSKTDGTVIKEEILAAGSEYQVPQTMGTLRLRAGNSGSLFFIVGRDIYGPAGSGTSVAKNVDLTASEIRSRYSRIERDQMPEEIIRLGWNAQVDE